MIIKDTLEGQNFIIHTAADGEEGLRKFFDLRPDVLVADAVSYTHLDITVNKNMVPFDSRSAFQTSGIRLGTPAITTRGAKEDLMLEIAEMIETVLSNVDNEQVIAEVRARVNAKMKEYPLFAY